LRTGVPFLSNNESFIDEVTEEVRRDKLFAQFRKYGWIGVVAVLGIVGGAAWNEYDKARDAAAAEAFGDAVSDALDLGGADARRDALAAIDVTGDQAGLVQLILASDPEEGRAETLAALDAIIAMPDLPQTYRDLATLRRVIVAGADVPLTERRAALEPVAAPGRPFAPLAQEQLGYLLIEEGKTDEAIAALTQLAQDQAASGALRGRAAQVITALGGTPPAPVEQSGTAPQPAPEGG
jgi:hypothetical protein